MKIKDLPEDGSLRGVWFYPPGKKKAVLWYSQWGYKDGKAGVFYKTDPKSSRIYPIFLDDLKEALEFEVEEKK